MQIVLHADKNREYEYAVDSGCSKEITIKKRTTLRVPDGSSTLVFRQAGFCKKQNIFFLALISFVLAFLESQDHEDKGYFASFYNFANGCFVADFDVELKSAQADDLEIYSGWTNSSIQSGNQKHAMLITKPRINRFGIALSNYLAFGHLYLSYQQQLQ